MKQIAFWEGVSWHRVEIEFWQIKNILEKMTAAASLRVTWSTTNRSQSCKNHQSCYFFSFCVLISAVLFVQFFSIILWWIKMYISPCTDFSISFFNPVRLHLLSKNILSKHFCLCMIFAQSQPLPVNIICIFSRSERAARKKTNNKSNNKQTLTKQTSIYTS